MQLNDDQKKKLFMTLAAILAVATVISLSAYLMKSNGKNNSSSPSVSKPINEAAVITNAASPSGNTKPVISAGNVDGSGNAIDNSITTNETSTGDNINPTETDPTNLNTKSEINRGKISEKPMGIKGFFGISHGRYYGHIILDDSIKGLARKVIFAVRDKKDGEKLINDVKTQEKLRAEIKLSDRKGYDNIFLSCSTLPSFVSVEPFLKIVKAKGLLEAFLEIRKEQPTFSFEKLGSIYILVEGPKAEVEKIKEFNDEALSK